MKTYPYLACTLALWLTGPAPAQQASDASTGLEELRVLGTRLEETIPQDLRSFGNRVEVVTADELAQYTDVGQSLQMAVPGLYVAPKNGAFDYMNCSLQGSRCQDILWLIDGVRINNRLYNTTSPLDTVPASIVDRIEVLYGGQGIFYGTQSVAGVVNIVTKPFTDTPEGSVATALDTNGGLHANVNYSISAGDHQLVAYGSTDEADGFQPFSDSAYQPSGTDRDRGYDVLTGGLKYAYAFNPDSRIALHFHRSDNTVDFAAPSRRRTSFNARIEDLVTAKWDVSPRENVDVFVKAYYHKWNSHWTRIDNALDANGNLTGGTIEQSNAEFWGYRDYGLNAVARVSSGGSLEYAAGFEQQRFSGRDDVLLIADRTESVNAVFGQVRTAAGAIANTRLALGVRHNRPSGSGDVTVWNVSGKHDFSSRLYLRGTAGTSFRLPDAYQLYGNDPCCTLGNPDLRGEKSRNLNVAVGGDSRLAAGLSWELIVFARAIDDLIGAVNGVQNNTAATVDFRGWETSLAAALGSSWSVRFDYLAATAEPRGSDQQITGLPKSSAKLGLSHDRDGSPYEFGISLLHVGDVFDDVGGVGRIEHGNYTVVDLTGAYRWGADNRHRIGVRLENVFDETYATSMGRAVRDADASSYAYGNLGTPRTWYVSYRYSF